MRATDGMKVESVTWGTPDSIRMPDGGSVRVGVEQLILWDILQELKDISAMLRAREQKEESDE